MNKSELVAQVADRTGLPRGQVAQVVDAATEVIRGAVTKGQKVALVGFGTFERQTRRPRLGRNPHTGDPVKIPARRVPVFKAGTSFRDSVAGGRGRKREAPGRKKAAAPRRKRR